MCCGTVVLREMLDFCAELNITSDIEMIRMDEINGAYERIPRRCRALEDPPRTADATGSAGLRFRRFNK